MLNVIVKVVYRV